MGCGDNDDDVSKVSGCSDRVLVYRYKSLEVVYVGGRPGDSWVSSSFLLRASGKLRDKEPAEFA